ncbi:hypothetical protein E3Q19_01666 [Wallemia mellicola]|nr:hypothetical protein E3Q19_01666 [Wallemia mellicola]
MKYVGLISGGKDSIFNLLHCRNNGHELIAVANLKNGGAYEEMDSYMFQTVGLSILPLIAQSLGVELYEGLIKGTPINQQSTYEQTLNDETEDLFELLQTVKTKHPDLEGVSVGAILSNYQRVRVEHVCSRLGLTVLAYLWRRPQDKLLDEMVAAQQTSVVIKVAGAGLDPERHLGKSLAQLRPTLDKLHNLYGSHVCGEGGEFETVTLDSPLYKQRIVLDDVEVIYHDPSPNAPVAYLRINKAHLEDKDEEQDVHFSEPEILDEISQEIQPPAVLTSNTDGMSLPRRQGVQPPCSTKVSSNWLTISNVYSTNAGDISTQTHDILQKCSALMQEKGFIIDEHTTFISVYIADMSDFSALNEAYGTYFQKSGPPARACIATNLGETYKVAISLVAKKDSSRSALHVRGQSYWAPANIGPYSQSITLNNRHFISGQIALKPSTLTLVEGGVSQQAILSLQHARKVSEALAPVHITAGELLMRPESVICYVTSRDYVSICQNVLQQAIDAHSERSEDCLDVITQKPAQLYVVVDSLPKNAAVEWQFVYNDRPSQISYDSEDEDAQKEDALNVTYNEDKLIRKHHARSHEGVQCLEFLQEVTTNSINNSIYCTVYYTPLVSLDEAQKCIDGDATFVPVKGIFDKNIKEAKIALNYFVPSK